MKAKGGKQKANKRRDDAKIAKFVRVVGDRLLSKNLWPVLLDLSAVTEPQYGRVIHSDENERFTTPKKLRGKPSSLRNDFLAWLKLPEEKKFYWFDGFWRDLCMGNVKFPLVMPALMHVLWRATRQDTQRATEHLRMLADYIDALNAKKSDRGQRLLVTEVLYLYARRVEAMEQPTLTWQQLRDEFWPDYPDSNANWQKFLRERRIPFKRVGQFRVRKRVRKSRNNTRSPH
jgi:hypothetical protein